MLEYQTTRGEVIEKGVSLEAGISGLIGMLLDIDVENSLSLGSKNTSLSLNAKVNLLSDLKFVPKEIIWQFQTFAEIRNKFAHVQSVDSFVKCFEILADKKNKFIKTFGGNIGDEVEEEVKLSVCFSFLCMSLGLWLDLILKKTVFNKEQDFKKVVVVETLRNFFKIPEDQKDIVKKQLMWVDKLIQDIEVDNDFVESIEHVRKQIQNKGE
ncbi:hypothetical protein [Arcicella rosea]|uniref:Mannitol repressor n=1 Tax=Arcicella rosea TaxID=502909 RepID=A0A841ER01_9BACT|nr:hypothetical protein [Arcicella rosea]MBB6002690.1 hypothetical protein [Arcicella rosea]